MGILNKTKLKIKRDLRFKSLYCNETRCELNLKNKKIWIDLEFALDNVKVEQRKCYNQTDKITNTTWKETFRIFWTPWRTGSSCIFGVISNFPKGGNLTMTIFSNMSKNEYLPFLEFDTENSNIESTKSNEKHDSEKSDLEDLKNKKEKSKNKKDGSNGLTTDKETEIRYVKDENSDKNHHQNIEDPKNKDTPDESNKMNEKLKIGLIVSSVVLGAIILSACLGYKVHRSRKRNQEENEIRRNYEAIRENNYVTA